VSAAASKWKIPDTGLWGFSHCGFFDTWYPWMGAPYGVRLERLVGDLVASGADSFRPQIHWHQVEPMLASAISRPEDVTEQLVDGYSRGGNGINWELYDQMIDSLVASGIEPHIVVGAAYDFQVPSTTSGRAPGRAVPDNIGRESYLAHVYLHARAAVRRYRGRVHMWQLENELNGAGETMLVVRWRTGRSWLDTGFQTAIMDVLARAVREEDPTALTSHNFITDWKLIKGVYDWREDVRRWLSFIDIVGVDTYPNYVFGWPSRGRSVGKKVAQAVEISEGKPVMVLETGYPARPKHRGMSEGRQVEYARDAIGSAVEAGACGFYDYLICSPEGYPTEGPWSNRFFQSIEPWWGFIRCDDTKRPAWFAYVKAMEEARSQEKRG